MYRTGMNKVYIDYFQGHIVFRRAWMMLAVANDKARVPVLFRSQADNPALTARRKRR